MANPSTMLPYQKRFDAVEISMETSATNHEPNGLIPLTVAVVVGPNLRPKERERLRSRLSSLLDELRQEYAHTPIVLVTTPDDTVAADLARDAGGILASTSHISHCSVSIAPKDGDWEVTWRRDRQPASIKKGPEPHTFRKAVRDFLTKVAPYCFGETISASRRQLETFNADVIGCSLPCTSQAEEALSDAVIRASGNEEKLRLFRRWYATADALAIFYQRRAGRWVKALVILGFLSALTLKIGYYVPDVWAKLYLYYVLLTATSVTGVTLRYWLDYRRKHLDYRALAEGLRVGMYWRYAGFDFDWVPADHYPHLQWPDLRWIRMAIRSCWLRTEPTAPAIPAGSTPPADRLAVIQKQWVETQRDFFKKAGPRDQKKFHIGMIRARCTLSFGCLCLVVYGLLNRHEWFSHLGSPLRWLFGLFDWNMAGATILEIIVCIALMLFGARTIYNTRPRGVWLPQRKWSGWCILIGGFAWLFIALNPVLPSLESLKAWPLGQWQLNDDLRLFFNVLYVVAITGSFLLGFVIIGYYRYLGLEKHAQRYTLMEQRYADELRELKKLLIAPDVDKANKRIQQLGIEALAESGDWIELHRQKSEEGVHDS